jgi:diguanylate cyclase (GGDEF)-like protein/PAS domain S-box-containing protein
MITGASGTIQWINPAFSRLSGYSKEELIGQNPRMLSSGRHAPAYYQNMWETITQGRIWRSETEERTKAGTPYTVSQIITPMKNDDGEITHFIAIHEDITAQKQVQQRIEQMAHYDALTGLPNRALFYDRLKHSLSLARRHHGELVLMFLDLDGFKKVNDTLGHRAGDMLLSQVAQRLRQCVRESDTVARLGGDEFTVICNDLYQGFDAARIAEKLIESIAQPFDLEGQAAHIGVSIGIARLCEHTRDPDELLHQADQAMYEAKLAGKNTYRLSISA